MIGTAAAALLAAVYVIAQPPSRDLAAHLFDASLFDRTGFAPWDTLWYAGHAPLAYSVLFPPVAALLSPQLAAALAAVGTAALLEWLVRRHLGRSGLPVGALLGAATAISLYTGRLAFAAGALPAVGAIAAIDRSGSGSAPVAAALAVLAGLLSPLAALFCALGATAQVIGAAVGARRRAAAGAAAGVALSALLTVGLLTLLFGQPGTEPFALSTLLPALAVCVGGAVLLTPARRALRAGLVLYALGLLLAWIVPSALGANAARLATLAAAPLGILVARERGWHPVLLAGLLVPLLYIGWQAPFADVLATTGDPSVDAAYDRPLVAFLARQWRHDGPFRVEVPFTASHWEAWWVGRRFPLARGWERQLDEADDRLFYRAGLTAAAYDRWLRLDGVRFVALPDAPLDPSARAEAQIIRGRPSFLRPVARTGHWQIDAVVPAPALATGPLRVTGLAPTRVSIRAGGAGDGLVRVRFTPYWALRGIAGCVSRGADGMTEITVRASGRGALVSAFALGRIGASGPRCEP